MSSKISIGGQALIEGVMMRSKNKYAIAVRKPDKKISTKVIKIKEPKNNLLKLPIIRGCIRFIETLVIGIKSISYSAVESQGEEEEAITDWEIFLTVALSIALTIVLFYMIPLLLAKFFAKDSGFWFNFIDGITRLGIFVLYLFLISLFPDVRRVFQYHGAEHKTVACYEKKEKLSVNNIKKYSTIHPRCGTSFLLIVFVLSIFFFTLVQVQGYFQRLGMRLLLLPLIAGISYELLKFAGKHYNNSFVKILVSPGLLLQKITTKEPTNDMIEVAVKSLKAVV